MTRMPMRVTGRARRRLTDEPSRADAPYGAPREGAIPKLTPHARGRTDSMLSDI
jgi:hypothetical protein